VRNYQAGIERGANRIVEQGWSYCDLLASESEFLATNLRQSWEQPGAPGISEQAAMWYAVGLVDDCQQAFGASVQPEHDVHQLIRLHPDAGTRYEAEAALAMLVRFDVVMAPYRLAWNRVVGKSRGEGGMETVCRLASEHEPAVVEAWHDWLWQPGTSAYDHGDASLFAIAASRLSQSMGAVLSLEPEPSHP
jgi:hypothetical protein